MTAPTSRASWWDDLAAMCAAPIARAPSATLIGCALLALLIGRHDLDVAAGVQVAAGALLGAGFVRLGTVRAGAFPLWLVPVAVAAAHLLDSPSYDELGAPLAVATGAALAWEGVVSRRRLPVPLAVVLVWGGIAAARAQSLGHDSLPKEWLHFLDLGWPLALAGAALMLAGPSAEERLDRGPRRPARWSTAWLVWGLAPALAMAVPDPAVLSKSPSWQAPLDLDPAAAILVVAFAVRVAMRAVDAADPGDTRDAGDARERTVARIASRPWTAAFVLMAVVVALDMVARGAGYALLETSPGGAVTYSSALVWGSYPAPVTCGIAVLAHGPFRRAKEVDQLGPYVAVFGVVTVAVLAPYVPVFLAEELSVSNVWALIARPWSLLLLVPLVMGRFVPERPHRAGGVDHLAGLAMVLAPIVVVLTKREGESLWLGDAALAVIASFLFHRLVACRVRPRTLFFAALLAGAATTILLVAIELDPHSPFTPRSGYAPFPSLEHPNQLRVFLPVVAGWCAALLPLFFARALVAAPNDMSCASPDCPPGR